MSPKVHIPDILQRLHAGLSQQERDLMQNWADDCPAPNRAQDLLDIVSLATGRRGTPPDRLWADFPEK